MTTASLKELLIEFFLRKSSSQHLQGVYWTQRDGKYTKVSEMTDTHLANSIRMCLRVEAHQAAALNDYDIQMEAMDCCDILDKDYCGTTNL